MTPSIRAFLQVRAASSPQWLDGGARLAFLTGITGIPQAWAVPAAGGWPDQLTFGTERVGSLLATADGSALAFERDVGGDERHRLHLAEPERALADADAIHRLGCWSPDGTRLAFTHTARNGVDFDLAIVDLASGQRRELAQPGGWSIAADWAEGGILVVRAFSNADHTLYLVDPDTGAVEHLTPHEGDVQYGSPQLLPDGSVLCATDLGSEFCRLAVLRDGEPEFLTPDSADVEEIALHGERRAWTVNEEGYGRVVLDGEPLGGLPDGVPGGLAFSPDGERLALHLSQPDDTTTCGWSSTTACPAASPAPPAAASHTTPSCGRSSSAWRASTASRCRISATDRATPRRCAGCTAARSRRSGRRSTPWCSTSSRAA